MILLSVCVFVSMVNVGFGFDLVGIVLLLYLDVVVKEKVDKW